MKIARRGIAAWSFSVTATLYLSACSNPYGQTISSASYDGVPAAGEITVSSPRMYRREALVNERRDEVTYLRALVEGSKIIKFEPEIMRQLEVVRAISASIGLKFDPASGAQYRRTDGKAEIQQQLDVLDLNMKLDKLKREAELLREALPKQTAPGENAGNPAGVGDGKVTVTPVTTNSTTELVKTLEQLVGKLQSALAGKFDGMTKVGITANPIDEFTDRAAYREILSSALGAASLDELHDRDGSALVRLNMMATVFPPDQSRTTNFGRLQMVLKGPAANGAEPEFRALYRDWMTYISPQLTAAVPGVKGKGIEYRATALGSVFSKRGALVDVVRFEFSRDKDVGCRGLALQAGEPILPGCQFIRVAAPRLTLSDPRGSDSQLSLGNLSSTFAAGDRVFDTAASLFLAARSEVAARNNSLVSFDASCGVRIEPVADGPGLSLGGLVNYAFGLEALLSIAPDVESRGEIIVRALDRTPGLDAGAPGQIYYRSVGQIDTNRVELARAVVDRIRASATRSCASPAALHAVTAEVPQGFLAALNYGSSAVYQLGPRQQVQIVSTEARAADAIALAATLAAASPSAGIGGDAALGFSRSASGRVGALERVPLVVAFADSTSESSAASSNATPRFGWMMGPRAVVDTQNKKINFVQGLRPQELTADLVVPGWWPYLYLETSSTWAPQWTGRGGKTGTSGSTRFIKVPLTLSNSDFGQLTSHLLGGSSLRIAEIDGIEPSVVPICAVSFDLQLRGTNIWRAEKVVVGGVVVKDTNVSVLAGMEGLLVHLENADFPIVKDKKAVVTALTPYGPATGAIDLTGVQADCAKPKKAEAPPAAAGAGAGAGAAKP